MMNTSKILVAVAAQEINQIETFIRDHIERLPADVHVLYGGIEPAMYQGSTITEGMLTKKVGALLTRRRGKLYCAAVKRLIDRQNFAAVLAEYGPVGISVADACRQTGIPLIVHFHGYDASRKQYMTGKGADRYRKMFDVASAVVAVSNDMRDRLMAIGCPKEILHNNPYGIDTTAFEGARPDDAGARFIAVGRFVEKKAPYLTLLAYSKVLSECPTAKLTFVGGGPLLAPCEQIARGLGLEGTVDFKGRLTRDEISSLMKQSGVFVQHSITAVDGNREGTPLSILEASCTGLPVVSTRHEGIKQSVIDGESGFLVDECDVDAMADRMVRLAKDSELRASMGETGRKHICANYNLEDSIARLWGIIDRAISV